MSTRGAWGFRLDGLDRIFYNHSDSGPSGLGEDIVKFCRSTTDWDAIATKVKGFVFVDGEPSDEQKQLAVFLNAYDPTRGGFNDVYFLTRNCQGDVAKTLELGFGKDSSSFIYDGLFCEYAYIMNIDTDEMEFYIGYIRSKDQKGRYAMSRADGYHGVTLVGVCPLRKIPKGWRKKFYNERW